MRKAVVIGIDDYAGMPLSGCVNDAMSIASILRAHGTGSPNFDVRTLTSPSHKITRAFLRKAIEKLFSGEADIEIALFYFSGHGCISSTGGYIVTSDFERYDEGVSMDDILTLANKSHIRHKVIILDCCHSGKFASPDLTGTSMALLGDGVTALTACRSDEPAMECSGKGIFTSLVIDALQGGAADLLGEISPGGVYAYVDRALGPWAWRDTLYFMYG